MLKAISTYILCYCGGYGAGTILCKGITEKKPWKIIVGAIFIPLSIIGGGFAGAHAFDDLVENEDDEDKED